MYIAFLSHKNVSLLVCNKNPGIIVRSVKSRT